MIKKTTPKEILAESFLELSKIKSVERITVADITRNCSMRRENFYYHFSNKYELISWIYSMEGNDIMTGYYAAEPWSHVLTRFLTYMQEYYHFYRSAFADSSNINFYSYLFKYTYTVMEECILKTINETKLPSELQFCLRYYCHAAINSTKDWLFDGMEVKVCFIGEMISESMPPQLKKFFP